MASDESTTVTSEATGVDTPQAADTPPATADPLAATPTADLIGGSAGPEGDQAPAPRKRAAKKAAKRPVKKASAAEAAPDEAATAERPAGETSAESAEGTAADAEAAEETPAPAKRTRKATKAAKTTKTARKSTKKASEVDASPGVADAGPGDDVAPDTTDLATDETATDGTQSDTPAATTPVVPSFGLLFQPPETPAPRSRRATAPAQAPTLRPAESDESQDTPDASASDGTPDGSATDTGTTDEANPTGGAESADAGEGTGRRRRRGGRGRRGRATGEGSETPDNGTNSDGGRPEASAEPEGAGETDTSTSGPSDDSDASDAGEGSATARRRRRRRRGGSGAAEGEDPPGTVTRVREPRAQRDEPTAVRGSTRLEAKKQRRREGREAGRRRTIITEAEFLARRESVERVMAVRGRGDKTQIGVLEDGVLVEHYVSREATASMAGNVYLGRVQNVLPSMEAAFVDIGKGRNAVLYAGEVNWDAAGLEVNQAKRIENALKSGDTVLVQVTKDPIGHKGARLTSQISLPGRFLVYVPEGQMTGISRKLPENERARLKGILKEIVPDSAGVIVRTAAEGATEEELRADVERLSKIWASIEKKAKSTATKKAGSGGAPMLVHGEADLTVRVIRDVFTEDFASLVVSGDKAWADVSSYVEDVAPDLAPRLSQWTSEEDIFTKYRVDEQIAKAMDRKVWLPSGGSLVIDRTEAMTVVDVNTGKFVGSGGNLEETVTKNNIEAAEEIVRQLRLRDIGGIIVIDFIDMVLESNRELVVRRLLECLGRDRTKHQVAEVTSLGLVQMTRKRVGSGLIEVFSETCEHCNGSGIIIHSEPIDRAPAEAGNGGGSTGSGSSRSRSRGGSARGGEQSRQSGTRAKAEPARPSGGPTAAQIAAAAHAAAVKSMSGEPIDDDVAALAGQDVEVVDATTAPAEAPDAAETQSDEPTPVTPERAPEPEPKSKAESEPESTAVIEPEAPVASTPPTRTRRKRGRVVAPAGPPRHTEEAAPGTGSAPSGSDDLEP